MIKIVNTAKWEIADEYFNQYKTKIEYLFPELFRKTIEICESNSFINSEIIDYDSPTQMFSKDDDPLYRLNNDVIIYISDYFGSPNDITTVFNKNELFALISHEIGHWAAYYRNVKCDIEKLERIADNCALRLNLGESLVNALETIKTKIKNNPVQRFDFMTGVNPMITENRINKRINRLNGMIPVFSIIKEQIMF